MPVALLLLLMGTLAAELTLFGLRVAALAGAVLLGLSGVSFMVVAWSRAHQTEAPDTLTVPSLSRRAPTGRASLTR